MTPSPPTVRIGAEYGRTMDVTIEGHNCVITACSDPVASAGILRQTITFTSLSDGTDDGLEITIVNNESDNRVVEAS
jgi:hypothetical protein